MPISATGNKPLPKRTAGERGFTLVELMVVLVLIGLLSAAALVALPDPGGDLREEAERFAARVQAAREQAIIGGTAMAVRVTGDGYGFDRRRDGQWQAVAGPVFVDRRWGDGIAAGAASAGTRIVFDPTGLAEPADIVLQHGGSRAAIRVATDGSVNVTS